MSDEWRLFLAVYFGALAAQITAGLLILSYRWWIHVGRYMVMNEMAREAARRYGRPADKKRVLPPVPPPPPRVPPPTHETVQQALDADLTPPTRESVQKDVEVDLAKGRLVLGKLDEEFGPVALPPGPGMETPLYLCTSPACPNVLHAHTVGTGPNAHKESLLPVPGGAILYIAATTMPDGFCPVCRYELPKGSSSENYVPELGAPSSAHPGPLHVPVPPGIAQGLPDDVRPKDPPPERF